jgi:hypothetical protein
MLWLSPGPGAPPDAEYHSYALERRTTLEIDAPRGGHARRYVLRDARGALHGSGAVWPEPGRTLEVDIATSSPPAPRSWDRPSRSQADGRRRVFAILADCGDWRLTQYLRARGELPFQDHLFAEGFRAVLESRPAFTAAALQSLVWPSRPTDSGTLGWIHHLGLELAGLEAIGRNPVDWLRSLLPARPNLFESLGANRLVAANMLLAHGHLDAGRHAEIIGPNGRRRNLASQNAYRTLHGDEVMRHPALLQDAASQRFAETIAAEMDAAEQIARNDEVDFLFLRLEALDLMTHAHFGAVDGTGQDDGRGALLASYRYIDDRLSDLYALLDEDDWFVLLSDHGIRSSMQHEEDAIFVVEGRGVPQGRAPGQPALRGVSRSLAAMLQIETDWPETGATPWLRIESGGPEVAARR